MKNMDTNIITAKNSELLIGAATALSNQWSPSWTEKLETLGKQFKRVEDKNLFGTNREEFLEDNPGVTEEHLAQSEAIHGKLERFFAIDLTNDRTVMILRFENAYQLEFQNNKGEDSKFVLSREAMFILCQAHTAMMTLEEYNAEWQRFNDSLPATN